MEIIDRRCEIHVYDVHGIDIGELNTVSDIVKYVNYSGYVKVSGFIRGHSGEKISFEFVFNNPNS